MGIETKILSILNSQMIVLGSWGFHNEATIENGIKFNVCGYIFKGIVKVIINETKSSYNICLENDNGILITKKDDICPEELVNVIDALVEKNCSQEEYEKKVIAECKTNRCSRIFSNFVETLRK